jgi:hypothetical protein
VLNAVICFVVVSALACAGCGGQRVPNANRTDSSSEEASGGSVGTTISGAACPARNVTNEPENKAESGSALWLQGFGDALEVTSVASDTEGNALLARSGGQTLKLDANGALLWSKPFGSLVATDTQGNAYLVGTLEGTLELGSHALRAKGGRDVFVIKLDPNGNVLYGVTLGGPDDDDVLSLAVDSNANAVVSGTGIGTVKLDRDANVLWTKGFHGHIALDSLGNILLTGALTTTVDFGGGGLTSAGGTDIFVAKLAPTGEHLFSRRFGDAAERQRGETIAVDRSDNVLVGGVFDGAVDFGGGALSLPSRTCPDEVWCLTAGFVTKLDAQGQWLWSLSLGPMRALPGVAADSRGNVVLSGALPGGVSPFRIPLVSELNPDGTELWRRVEWPETGIGAGHRVAVDPCDNVLWSLSVRPTLESDEQSYIAKLSP